MVQEAEQQSFWDHLDILRTVIIRIIVVTVVFGIAAFCFKDLLFRIILAPKDSGFVTYRLFDRMAALAGGASEPFGIELINTGLAQQFITHMKVAMCMGVLCASPYILYQLFRFVSPALYANERRYVVRVAGSGYVMFIAGVLLSYFLIFPLTFRFLGTYQVSYEVQNMIALESYISTLLTMCLLLGVVFEMPVLCWLFGRLGFLSAEFMRRYRKHAIVLIVVAGAVITPTSDVFTLSLVALPMWLLYELSILLVRHANR